MPGKCGSGDDIVTYDVPEEPGNSMDDAVDDSICCAIVAACVCVSVMLLSASVIACVLALRAVKILLE